VLPTRLDTRSLAKENGACGTSGSAAHTPDRGLGTARGD